MSCWPDFHKISSICSGNIFANPAIFILTEFLFLLKILKVSTNFPAIPRISRIGLGGRAYFVGYHDVS